MEQAPEGEACQGHRHPLNLHSLFYFIIYRALFRATAFTKDSILLVPAALDSAPRPHLANTRIHS